MRSAIQILAVFTIVFSMVFSSSVLPVQGNMSTCLLNVPPVPNTIECLWVPSGPASDQILYRFYSSDLAELQAMCINQASTCVPQLDFSDVPVSPSSVLNDPRFTLTSPTPQLGQLEVDFNQASTFWGVPFNFGRDGQTCPSPINGTMMDCTAAAIAIRQGIAHLIDKVALTRADATFIGPNADVIDNPLTPASMVLHSGYPYDSSNPNATRYGCIQPGTDPVNCNDTGPYAVTPGASGSLTHAVGQQAVALGTTGSEQVGGVCTWDRVLGCSRTPISAFHYYNDSTDSNGMVLPGQPDFCIAAQDFIDAGLATGMNSQCELTGDSSSLSNGNIVFTPRSSLGRHLISFGLPTAICELVDLGAISCPQVSVPVLGLAQTVDPVYITGCALANGALPPGCSTVGPNTGWNMHAGGYFFATPLPNTEWGLYDSAFASNYCGGSPGQMSPNYEYICNTRHDTWVEQSQFLSTSAAAEASLQVAMDIFGNHTFNIPLWTPSMQYPFVNGWTGVSNAAGIGTAQGNSWTLLNAWNPNPAIMGPTIRWGQKAGTTTINPFLFSSVVESDVLQEIYDPLLATNPYSPNQPFGWMVNSYSIVTNSQDPACPASVSRHGGVFAVAACVKLTLRGDISWHDIFNCPTTDSACLDSHVVTASDVKFSYANFNSTGSFFSQNTANIADVVYVPGQLPRNAFGAYGGSASSGASERLYVALKSLNAWALFDLAAVPIVPQHVWAEAASTGPCLTLDTPSCTVEPLYLSGASSDPMLNNRLVGSGPFVCASGVLGATGTVYGGGCAFNATGAPTGQSIPAGGTAVLRRFGSGLNQFFAYFRSNGKFKQFQWAAHNNGVTATTGDVISALACMNGSLPSGSPTCQHWSSPASGTSCNSSAGPCVGAVGGGHGSVNTAVILQIAQWIGRGAWNPGVSYNALYGAQGAPQTIYEDGTVESPPPPPP